MPGSRFHTKHTLYLDPGSLDILREIYPKHTASEILRHIIKTHIDTLYVEMVKTPRPEINLEVDDSDKGT